MAPWCGARKGHRATSALSRQSSGLGSEDPELLLHHIHANSLLLDEFHPRLLVGSAGKSKATCRFRRCGSGTEVSPCVPCVRNCSWTREATKAFCLSLTLSSSSSVHYTTARFSFPPSFLSPPSSFFAVPPPPTELISVSSVSLSRLLYAFALLHPLAISYDNHSNKMLYTTIALAAAACLVPLTGAVADPDPRPPGPPPKLDYAKLGSLSLTPKQALDADARAVDQVRAAHSPHSRQLSSPPVFHHSTDRVQSSRSPHRPRQVRHCYFARWIHSNLWLHQRMDRRWLDRWRCCLRARLRCSPRLEGHRSRPHLLGSPRPLQYRGHSLPLRCHPLHWNRQLHGNRRRRFVHFGQ